MPTETLDTNAELLSSYAESGSSVGEGVIRLSGQSAGVGTHMVYITRAEARGILSIPTGHEDALDLVCITATRWVLWRVGELTLAEDILVYPPYDLELAETTAGRRQAAKVMVSRLWAGHQAPFGVLGGLGEEAVYTSTRVPEAELALLGQRTSFGIG